MGGTGCSRGGPIPGVAGAILDGSTRWRGGGWLGPTTEGRGWMGLAGADPMAPRSKESTRKKGGTVKLDTETTLDAGVDLHQSHASCAASDKVQDEEWSRWTMASFPPV